MSSVAPDDAPAQAGFGAFALHPDVFAVLAEVGYESPSPIQAATIPPLLAGRDVLGTAQTGTGKTAAFALPILSRLDRQAGKPQALVLAPTRELAIQVSEAFQRYAAHIQGFQVLPIYGGQSYGPQLHALRRGVHVVVGTPGRVIDHLDKGTLDLSALRFVVLDEADEMLRMGFIADVEKILGATPAGRQVALFSATMPRPIRRIAQHHLHDPLEVVIQNSVTTTPHIHQRYWYVSGMHKLDVLTRILEAEAFDAMIVFARTKQGTEELAGKLQARGFTAAAINGDLVQAQRERVIQQVRDGQLDILVATDVAARGLDVERISHVVNYDIPYDPESYIHRIGRTGRAGRSGEAILFVTPRERGMLKAIEHATGKRIEPMQPPSVDSVNDARIHKFKQRISDAIAAAGLDEFQAVIEQYEREHDVPASLIAAALAHITQGQRPLLLAPTPGNAGPAADRGHRHVDDATTQPRPRSGDAAASSSTLPAHGARPRDHGKDEYREREQRAFPPAPIAEAGKRIYRIEVGHEHGVKPGNIIGAIANESGLESRYIGKLSIRDHYSLIALPEGMPGEIFEHLKKVWVMQQQLRIQEWDGNEGNAEDAPKRSTTPRRSFRPAAPARPPHPAGGQRPPRRK